jgi:putative hydrolase of the HAD superfamily
MIKALLFDFDGIILDTETLEFNAFRDVSRDFKVEMTLEIWGEWAGTVGVRTKAVQYLAERLGEAFDAEEFESRFAGHYDKLLSGYPLFPGVKNIIADAKRLGLKIGLATSSAYQWSGVFLEKYGLIEEFDFIQTGDTVTKLKPDPEIYIAALNGLGIGPHEAIAFEDSPVGSRAAKAAGIYCIAVPSEVTKHHNFDHVDAVIPTLAGRTIQELVSMAEKANKEKRGER